MLVGLEGGHYVVKWHGSSTDSTSIPPLPTMLVINSSLLPFLSSLTVQFPSGGLLSHFHLILCVSSCLSSLCLSVFFLSFFLLSGAYISSKGQQNGPLQRSKQPGSFSCLPVDTCPSVLHMPECSSSPSMVSTIHLLYRKFGNAERHTKCTFEAL